MPLSDIGTLLIEHIIFIVYLANFYDVFVDHDNRLVLPTIYIISRAFGAYADDLDPKKWTHLTNPRPYFQ